MSMLRWLSLALLAVMIAPVDAAAKCKIAPGTFKFGRDAATTVVVDAEGCEHRYNADEKTTFTRSNVAARPASGILAEQSFMVFKYTPNPGFRGKDSYAVRVCGTALGAKDEGCSTITYRITVE